MTITGDTGSTVDDGDQDGEIFGQYDDEGVLPDIDRPMGVTKHGTTAAEMAEGAGINLRVTEEEPDPALAVDPPVDLLVER